MVKSAGRRLYVPNQAFLTREFLVMDDIEGSNSPSKRDLFPAAEVPDQMEEQLESQLNGYPPMPNPQQAAWMQQTSQHYSW